MILQKKAVIFDLDGVICFTDRFHYQAWKTLADSLDIYFDEKINNRLRGVSRMASLEIILENAREEYTQEEKNLIAEKKNDLYKDLLKNMSPADLSEEVRDTLQELRKRGYRLAIGSSSKNTKFILERIGLDGFFNAVADGTDITHSKPSPEVFLVAAEMLGEKPEDCAVVEDAKAGIEAAKAAGMTALALFGDAKECGLEDYDLTGFGNLLDLLQ
ncbi:MAG: beta-phosphoglucomutase [Eubacteriales bacterium]|nr:beta-phosphoglucomutase [Eubacteriales bacterium]